MNLVKLNFVRNWIAWDIQNIFAQHKFGLVILMTCITYLDVQVCNHFQWLPVQKQLLYTVTRTGSIVDSVHLLIKGYLHSNVILC